MFDQSQLTVEHFVEPQHDRGFDSMHAWMMGKEVRQVFSHQDITFEDPTPQTLGVSGVGTKYRKCDECTDLTSAY